MALPPSKYQIFLLITLNSPGGSTIRQLITDYNINAIGYIEFNG
jgi:hypothetical protein